jgi:hypothetical protein
MTDNQTESNLPSPDNHDNNQSPTSGGPLGNLDLSALRLSQDFASQMGAKKLVVTIPVRKPNRHAFVRVRPGEDWRFPAALLNVKDERETYLVHPELQEAADLGAGVVGANERVRTAREGRAPEPAELVHPDAVQAPRAEFPRDHADRLGPLAVGAAVLEVDQRDLAECATADVHVTSRRAGGAGRGACSSPGTGP